MLSCFVLISEYTSPTHARVNLFTPIPMSQIVGATHPGNRDHNEDCYVADAALGLGLVADGMGGYACGEVASALVRETIAEAIANSEGLRDAIARAHAVVRQEADSDDSKKGMGSTVIAFRIQGQAYELAWVGDSRAYLWDAASRTLHQITRDHSYVETLLSSGAISYDEAINHPNRNLITQAIGVAGYDGLEIELISGRLGENQQLLICSDGLVDEVVDDEIAEILSAATTLDSAVTTLVQRAVDNGGSDNVTVVIASCADAVETAIDPEFVRSTTASETAAHTAVDVTGDAPGEGTAGVSGPLPGGIGAQLVSCAGQYWRRTQELLANRGINPLLAVGAVLLLLVVVAIAVL